MRLVGPVGFEPTSLTSPVIPGYKPGILPVKLWAETFVERKIGNYIFHYPFLLSHQLGRTQNIWCPALESRQVPQIKSLVLI